VAEVSLAKPHSNIRVLNWFAFLIDFRLYGPFAIIYFAQVSGSYTVGMAVFSVVSISSALLEMPTGILSDRLGRRKTVILGAFFGVLSVASFAGASLTR
jgi:MFS family permease